MSGYYNNTLFTLEWVMLQRAFSSSVNFPYLKRPALENFSGGAVTPNSPFWFIVPFWFNVPHDEFHPLIMVKSTAFFPLCNKARACHPHRR